MKTIGIIGGGNMGAAILHRIHETAPVCVAEADPDRARTLRRKYRVRVADIPSVVAEAGIVILAVKPQSSPAVLAEISGAWRPAKVLISIAAGLTTGFLEERLPAGARVVRTMPNMPAQIGQGITAVCGGAAARPADIKNTVRIFNRVGQTVVVPESQIDAVTAVSGSGPAYVFLFAECLTQAAIDQGLAPELGRQLVETTLLGSARQLAEGSEEAAVLRQRVTSKGGTTAAALQVFGEQQLERIFKQAVAAAARRARELAQ